MQFDRDAGDAGLPVLDGRIAGVELVAGGVVADRADDAAVAGIEAEGRTGRVVGMHAPVELARQADDRQHADVDPSAQHRGRGGLVVGLVSHAGGVVAVAVGLFDEPLGHRVGALEAVVAVGVGGDQRRATIHQRVLSLAHRQGEVGHPGLAGVLDAVAVVVVEDVAVDLRPPAVDGQDAHVDDLAAGDADVDQVEDVVLRLVPPGEGVVAVGHVRDVEGAVGVSLAHVYGGVELGCAGQCGQSDPRLVDRRVDLGAGESAEDLAGLANATLGGHVHVDAVDDTLDLTGSGSRRQCGGRNEPEEDGRERLAALGELGVEAGRAFHDPCIPVVVALERGGLHPVGAVWRRCGERVAVRPEVRERQHACGVAEALSARVCGVRRRGVVRCNQLGLVDDVVGREPADLFDVVRADRVAEHVGDDLAEVVLDLAGEPGEAVLDRQVGCAVDRRDVFEDLRLDRGGRQRRGLQLNVDRVGVGHRHREVHTVELEAVGEHGDQVAAVGQRRQGGNPACTEVALVALGVDRRRGGDAHRGPVTTLRIPGVARRASGRAPRLVRVLLGRAGVVDVDDVLERGDRVTLDDRRPRLGALAGDVQREHVGRGCLHWRLVGLHQQDGAEHPERHQQICDWGTAPFGSGTAAMTPGCSRRCLLSRPRVV